MFSLFDPTGRGHISHEQYENGERAKPGNIRSGIDLQVDGTGGRSFVMTDVGYWWTTPLCPLLIEHTGTRSDINYRWGHVSLVLTPLRSASSSSLNSTVN